MFLRSFTSRLSVYRNYLISGANTIYISNRVILNRSYGYSSIISKHKVDILHFRTVIACKCQEHRRYSRGLDGDISDLLNAQNEKELSKLSSLFPNTRVTLNEFATKCPSSVFDIHYKQSVVTPKGGRKKAAQNDWICTYTFVWPEKIKFEGTAISKRQAAEKAAIQALHWLYANKRIDDKGCPIFDKTVIEELNSSIQEPIKASFSEASMERIEKIWKDYDSEIKDIYSTTFEAAKRRVVDIPSEVTKDSTIDDEDELSEGGLESTSNEATDLSEAKIPVHPVYGRHISPPTRTALDRRKRQLVKAFERYDEQRTPLPIDEYSYSDTVMIIQADKVEIENEENVKRTTFFFFREPIILLSIICLSVSKGITRFIQDVKIKGGDTITPSRLLEVWSLSATAVPMIGLVFFAFLSEIHGRKPTFITLYTLSIISSMLHLIPWQESIPFSFPVHGLVKGGTLIMGALGINEYCSPKHRFTYLMFNALVFHTVYSLTIIVVTLEARSYPYVQAFQILLMLVCLVSACKWPESPYWLASKGSLEDSREVFLWLRGEQGRKECNSMMEERRTPGPFKLYWLSFFVAVATISVAVFTNIGGRFFQRWRIFHPKDIMIENIVYGCGSIVIASVVSVISYVVKRKVLFILVTGISVMSSYAVSICILLDQTVEDPSNQLFYYVFFTSTAISTYGPVTLGIVLCIELIPLKYNTHMSCAVLLCNYIVYFPFMTLFWRSFGDFESSHVYLPLFTTLSLFGVIVYYCFAPETKDKTLLEIQKMYTPELSEVNTNEDHEITTHI